MTNNYGFNIDGTKRSFVQAVEDSKYYSPIGGVKW